ncbi:hypothetical protein CMQ_1350 [Grosmannia clavigera kw1407]|uniref:C6 zinc finger domain containing protein n=1 Tax=Grosmannia clavigera (strain kw1407 / UAMH 11150) TaxID=655863 RepID=F0XF54_GROCL|nr:uncharacterized protein CMQ_1350 [Grosmannia clavigera kw1407]EFX04422.1 hypothetical protein CMQ_1350 [Grosmannia clavigera kw1407]
MTNTPTADSLPIAAVRHAVTIGYIARQALAHTACLQAATASANVARWLHDAVLVVIGFTASYPVCPPSTLARRAIDPTLEALAMCGAGIGLGLGLSLDAEVAELRRLAREADDILDGFSGRRTGLERPAEVPATPASCLAAPAAGEPDRSLVTELQGSVYSDLDPVGNAEFWAGFMQQLDTPVQNCVPG